MVAFNRLNSYSIFIENLCFNSGARLQVVEKIGIYNILVGLFGVRANRLGFEHSDNPYNQCDKTACAQNPGHYPLPTSRTNQSAARDPCGITGTFYPHKYHTRNIS